MAGICCEASAGTVRDGPGYPDVLETGDEGSICVRRRRVALEHNRQHPLLNTCYVYLILHCKKISNLKPHCIFALKSQVTDAWPLTSA